VAGEWYDTVSETVKTGNRTSIRVEFSENISVPSIVAAGFRIAGVPAISALTHAALPNDVFLTVESFPTVGPVILMIDPGSITDLSGIKTSLVPITVTDKVPPQLTITFDRPATNTLVIINVVSDEILAAPPAITVNGLTRSVPTEISQQEWELVFNVVSLTGADAGQGVKTVSAFGFDSSNTMGTATPVTFQVDTTVVAPALTPSGAVQVLESSPVIIASYSTEADEYVGDTHVGMSLILATLDGVPVSSLMSTVDSGATWTLKTIDVQPDGLENGVHIFQIMAVDAAGNTHEVTQTVFEVFVDPTLTEAVVEPTPVENTTTTTPTEESIPVEEVLPVEGSSEEADVLPATDPATPEESISDTEVIVDPVDPPADQEQAVEPVADTTDGATAPAVVDDTVPATSDEPEAAVMPETESTPIESANADDAGAAEASGPAEPVRDLIYDREAELVGVDAIGVENSSGSSSEHASTIEDAGGTVFGCNLPLGNSNVVGGEYALLGIGLLGLGLRRPAGALRDMLWPDREASDAQDSEESD
jgi:hypothetical protein